MLRVAMVVASALLLTVVGCAPGPSPSPPPPPRVECGPLDPTTCEAAVISVLATIADPPAAPIRVTFEEGSFCLDHLFDEVPCPPSPIPSGARWRGRAEVAFGNRYEGAFLDVVVGPAGIEPTLLAIASRPPAPPTD